jgi:hypothetical protein
LLIALQASAYQLGGSGLSYALKGAYRLKDNSEALPEITPCGMDLTSFNSVGLGSPIWLYSPAPPIWAAVEHNCFDGQHVVLFNTFNSHFGDDHIARLQAKVLPCGALSFEHRHVLRGRMTQQLTAEQMLQAIDAEWLGSSSEP